MTMLLLAFIIVQISLLMFMLLHDFISIPPLNDIKALEKEHSLTHRALNAFFCSIPVAVPLILTLYYMPDIPFWPAVNMVLPYGILTIGTICSWWIPYMFGSSDKHKAAFSMFKNTHHFLPVHGDNVIPNTLHVLLHLQVWFCFGCSIYVLLKAG